MLYNHLLLLNSFIYGSGEKRLNGIIATRKYVCDLGGFVYTLVFILHRVMALLWYVSGCLSWLGYSFISYRCMINFMDSHNVPEKHPLDLTSWVFIS